MIRWCVLFVFLARPAFATITFDKHASACGNSTNVTATTAAISTTGDALIVIRSAYYIGNSVTPTISDSASNNWGTAIATYSLPNNAIQTYYRVSPSTSATHTFSATGDYPCIFVETFTISAASITYDSPNQNGTAAAQTPISPGSVTPSACSAGSSCVVITGVSNNCGATVPSISGGGGYTLSDATGVVVAGGMAYQIQTSPTATNPSWASNCGAANTATDINVFRESGGGGGGGTCQVRTLLGVGCHE